MKVIGSTRRDGDDGHCLHCKRGTIDGKLPLAAHDKIDAAVGANDTLAMLAGQFCVRDRPICELIVPGAHVGAVSAHRRYGTTPLYNLCHIARYHITYYTTHSCARLTTMKLSRERQGELAILSGTLLWGFFPVIAFLSYGNLTPFMSLSVSSLFAALFFAIILTIRGKWHEVINVEALKHTLGATFIVGVLYYLLYYLGVRYSSPGNVGILGLTEVFFSFLLFHVWKKDYIPKEHILGALLVLVGAFIILMPNLGAVRPGDFLIVLGAAIVPFGNFFARRARELVATETIMFVRCMVSAIVISLVALLLHATSPFSQILLTLPFLVVNGVIMLGVTTFLWIEGIHRITVTKANALNSVSPLLTLLFAWIFLKTAPSAWQLVSFIPMFAGVLLLGKQAKKL